MSSADVPIADAVPAAVSGVVLASGLSRRLNGANKLLLPLGDSTVVRRTVESYCAADLEPVLVVVGHEARLVIEALRDLPVQVIQNPDFHLGQSRALVRGVSALPATATAAVIGVGDQPLLSPSVIAQLRTVWSRSDRRIVVPRYSGTRGNPVLFARAFFPELLQVQGDRGGRQVVDSHPDQVAWVDVPVPRLAADVDTWEQYQSLQAMLEGERVPEGG